MSANPYLRMWLLPVYWFVFSFVFLISACSDTAMPPPLANKVPKKLEIHQQARIDNYYWLNERNNPEVIEYLHLENAYTANWFKPVTGLRDKLFKEVTGRIKQNDETVPYLDNEYYYQSSYLEGKEYPIFYRWKNTAGPPGEAMLDMNKLAEGKSFCSVIGLAVSPDNQILAYGLDTVGRRKYTIRFRDLTTGKDLPDAIPVTTGQPVWANDNKTVFYSQIDDVTLRSCCIYRHTLGTDPAKDVLVYEEKDPTFDSYIYKCKSDKYLVIYSFSKVSNDCQILDANHPLGEFRLFQPRIRDLEYDIEHFQDKFYIRTNLQARNFRMMETPEFTTQMAAWKEVIPHNDTVLLENFEIFSNHIVLQERRNGLMTMEVIDLRNMNKHFIDFGEEAYLSELEINNSFDTPFVRYYYSSLTTPPSVIDYHMDTRQKKILKQDEVLGGFKSSDYEAKRLNVTAHDGKKIPLSLVFRKDKFTPDMPLLLYGYGAYGSSSDADFNSVLISLLDRGFIYAIAHVRGGEEMGREWYEDGKMLHKKNTFKDFISCAEYLIQQGYTSPGKLFASGRSAGGLLMGVIANERPDLFKGIVAGVPFVDVVTTMLDESLPLTTAEYDEWGDPHQKEYYDYMFSYSPYDNVKAQFYPAMFVSAGLHDSQVQYWEPAKWVAKLRVTKTDSNPLLLYTNMEAGHGGASGRFEKYKLTTMEYAFILHLLGINE